MRRAIGTRTETRSMRILGKCKALVIKVVWGFSEKISSAFALTMDISEEHKLNICIIEGSLSALLKMIHNCSTNWKLASRLPSKGIKNKYLVNTQIRGDALCPIPCFVHIILLTPFVRGTATLGWKVASLTNF